MSQMYSVGGSSTQGFKISRIVTDAGTAFPSKGIVEVFGSDNINTITELNNAIIRLNNSISITSANIGTVSVEDNNIITTSSNQNMIISPDGTGKIQLAYSNPNSALVTDDTLNLTDVGSMTNGQVVIGSTGNTPVASTLTAGPGISITNGPGSINIASSSGGTGFVQWEKIVYSGPPDQQTYQMEPNKGYIVDSNQFETSSGTAHVPNVVYPVFLTFPPTNTLQLGDIFYVLNIGYGGCALQLNSDAIVTMQPLQNDPNTGLAILPVYPGGVATRNPFAAIWFQYIPANGSFPDYLLNIGTFGYWSAIPAVTSEGFPAGLPNSTYQMQS